MTRLLYRVSEAAEMLGVSQITIWRRIKEGKLEVRRDGARCTRILASSLMAAASNPERSISSGLAGAPAPSHK